jgi:hypothetical protein
VEPQRVDLSEILQAVTDAAGQVAGLVRDTEPAVARAAQVGEWTFSQTMAHVIGTTRLYRRVVSGWASPLMRGGLPTLNAGYFAGLIEEDPVVLSGLLEDATSSYISQAMEAGGDTVCRFHNGLLVDVITVTAFLCNELLMHGWDIAKVTQRSIWNDDAALPTLLVMSPVMAGLVDPEILGSGARVGILPRGAAPFGYELAPGGAKYLPGGPDAQFDGVLEGSAFELRLWHSGRVTWEQTSLAASGSRPDVARDFRFLRV